MYYLCCLFDHRQRPPKPYFGVSYHPQTKDIKFYQMYQPGTKIPLSVAHENEKEFKKLLLEEEVVLSDFNSFISAFKLDLNRQYEVYDFNYPREMPTLNVAQTKKSLLVQLSLLLKVEKSEWQQILANSQLAYRHLENAGYYHDGKKCNPVYELTYSGRSKCLVNNVQGANVEDSIHHIDDDFNIFIHFDWVAADFRVASIISNDRCMKDSFKESDPYTVLYEALDSEEITREQCKIELFKSFYSMNPESLEFYPGFAKWMASSASKIEHDNCSFSILGKEFQLEKDRTIRSVFNAQVQGSVAHAMQSVLYRVYKMFPKNILTEVHDSLILCCNNDNLKEIIDDVSNIMLFPFDGILDSNPKFPLKVSVGFEWKKWKLYKECR